MVRAGLVLLVAVLGSGAATARAGEADVLAVKAVQEKDGTWAFDVTVHHADEGWKHYANGWEVVGPDGNVIAKRKLHHPHVEEQTFTRLMRHIVIPEEVTTVTVRAHDLVHGYGGKEETVQLTRRSSKEPSPTVTASAPSVSPTKAD